MRSLLCIYINHYSIRNETENKVKMSNILVFCTWSVFIIWFQLFILTCRAHQYHQIDNYSTSSLVFMVDAKTHTMPQNWHKIQHYMKLIADEFSTQQSDNIEDYRFIQNGWCYKFNDIKKNHKVFR